MKNDRLADLMSNESFLPLTKYTPKYFTDETQARVLLFRTTGRSKLWFNEKSKQFTIFYSVECLGGI